MIEYFVVRRVIATRQCKLCTLSGFSRSLSHMNFASYNVRMTSRPNPYDSIAQFNRTHVLLTGDVSKMRSSGKENGF